MPTASGSARFARYIGSRRKHSRWVTNSVPVPYTIVLVLSLVAPTSVPVLAHDASDIVEALKQSIEDINKDLDAHPSLHPKLTTELAELRRVLNEVDLRKRQSFLIRQSERLKSWLEEPATIRTDANLNAALAALIDTATTYEATNRSKAAGGHSRRFLRLLEKSESWRSEPSWPDLQKVLERLETLEKLHPITAMTRRSTALEEIARQLTTDADLTTTTLQNSLKLRDTLNALEEKYNPASSAAKRANSLADLLKMNVIELGASSHAHKAIQALQQEIGTVLDPSVEPKIHIVTATFGDVRKGAEATKQCDATPTLVNLCERDDECKMRTAEVLCGYDPAPFTATRHKSLTVKYSCVTAADEYWTQLQIDRDMSLEKHPSFEVVLRSQSASFRCNARNGS